MAVRMRVRQGVGGQQPRTLRKASQRLVQTHCVGRVLAYVRVPRSHQRASAGLGQACGPSPATGRLNGARQALLISSSALPRRPRGGGTRMRPAVEGQARLSGCNALVEPRRESPESTWAFAAAGVRPRPGESVRASTGLPGACADRGPSGASQEPLFASPGDLQAHPGAGCGTGTRRRRCV